MKCRFLTPKFKALYSLLVLIALIKMTGCDEFESETIDAKFLKYLSNTWTAQSVKKCDSAFVPYPDFVITFSISDSINSSNFIIDLEVTNGKLAFPSSPGLIAIPKNQDFGGSTVNALRDDQVPIQFINVKQNMAAQDKLLDFNLIGNADCGISGGRLQKTGDYAFKCGGV